MIERLYADAFAAAPIGIAILSTAPDDLGAVIEVNPALCGITGYSSAELAAPDVRSRLDVFDIGPPSERPGRHDRFSRLAAGALEPYRNDVRVTHADGRHLWLQVQMSVVRDHDDPPRFAMAHVQDVTEARQASQGLAARHAVARVVAAYPTAEGAAAALLGPLAEALEHDYAALWVPDGPAGVIRCRSVWSEPGFDAGRFDDATRRATFVRGESLPGRVWEAGAPEVVADVAEDTRCRRQAQARAVGLHGAVGMPVMAGGEVVAVLELTGPGRVGNAERLLSLLEELSAEIGGLLGRGRSDEARRVNDELLLVEDDEFIARLVHKMLASSYDDQLNLVHVETLAGARERLAASRPVCIVLDLTLPDAAGLDGLAELRERAPDVPIVVLTGLEDEQLAVRAVQQGAQDYLMKRKIDLQTLGRSIRYAIQRKEAEQQLLAHRLRHPLTGLPTSTLFLDRVRVALARAMPRCVAVIVLNVDRFRLVNDSLGHDAGDQLLRELTARLKRVAAPSVTVGSLGADGFTLLVEGRHADREAALLAGRLAAAIAEPFALEEEDEVRITASIGISVDRRDAVSAEGLLAEADSAMSRRKDVGGDGFEVFEDEVRHRLRERLRIESRLRIAIDHGELSLHYQPLVELETGTVTGFEALVRWPDGERGLVPPGVFIPIAEESGLIVPLGRWVLAAASRQLAGWRGEHPGARTLVINVNLAARELAEAALVEHTAAIVAHAGLQPRDVCLEITETALIEQVDTIGGRLEALKELGFSIALDDFGTGYSSLSQLERFPIDTIKLDRSFVAGLHDPRKSAIVAAVANMALGLGLPAVAEGVETADEAQTLKALGYAFAQGYWFGRPQPPEEAAAVIARLGRAAA